MIDLELKGKLFLSKGFEDGRVLIDPILSLAIGTCSSAGDIC